MNARAPIFLFGLFALITPRLAEAGDAEGEDLLLEAVSAYAKRDWDAAIIALEHADREASSATLRAQIARQFGLLYPELDRPEDALAAFRRALFLDPGISLDLTRVSPAVRTLFSCARSLPTAHPPVTRLMADGKRGWECPELDPKPSTTPQVDPPTPAPTPPPIEALPPVVAPAKSSTAAVPALLAPQVPPPSESGRLGVLGKVGVVLVIGGLAGGAGVFAWQTVESESAREDADELTARLSRPSEIDGPVIDVIRDANTARVAYADHAYYASIGASVGGGVAGAGLLLVLSDLIWGGGDDARETAFVAGPAGASLVVGF